MNEWECPGCGYHPHPGDADCDGWGDELWAYNILRSWREDGE